MAPHNPTLQTPHLQNTLQDTWQDSLIKAADTALRTLFAQPYAARPMPLAAAIFDTQGAPDVLAPDDRALAGSLMRVNHVGEVCAQALYSAQSLATQDPLLKAQYAHAAAEETDHLAWTAQRLTALGARPSLFNPLWYAGAFGLGLIASRLGDAASLGFVVETEQQVEAHLDSHLGRLPVADHESRAILVQMKDDESRHAAQAQNAGAAVTPWPVRQLMKGMSKVMTSVAFKV